ncbi:hypothetical protein ZIOFF_011945 [Zingiber officinale]|uniref:dUTPase-like domain-containing protein n=1 Tax=Zingiber officinale TaxID=94328 RepID=A0A8J5I6N7_ZINOF|nr:hypothetical protein ZIOFF_011945 [Zingiber officinale]
MALRRQGEEVTKIDMHTNILPDKKLRKNIQSCFRALNHMDDKAALSYIGDEEFDSLKVFKILKEARELTVSLLQSIFNFSSMPRPKTKANRWSLISNALHKRKIACKDESEDVEANDGAGDCPIQEEEESELIEKYPGIDICLGYEDDYNQIQASSDKEEYLYILVHCLTNSAVMLEQKSSRAAGFDLAVDKTTIIEPRGRALISTGLSLEIPWGTYGRIATRSNAA